MTFDQLLKKKKKTRTETMLLAAIASLSSKKGFDKMNFTEVYQWLEARGRSLFS